jgi:hypothetical protein
MESSSSSSYGVGHTAGSNKLNDATVIARAMDRYTLLSDGTSEVDMSSLFRVENEAPAAADNGSAHPPAIASAKSHTSQSNLTTLPLRCISMQFDEFMQQTRELVNLLAIHDSQLSSLTASTSSSTNNDCSIQLVNDAGRFSQRGVDNIQTIIMNMLDIDGKIRYYTR